MSILRANLCLRSVNSLRRHDNDPSTRISATIGFKMKRNLSEYKPPSTISVLGLGKLGIPLAVIAASCGFSVIGVDTNENTIDSLREGRSPIQESGLQDLLTANMGHLRFTSNYTDAIRESDATFIVVPTPSNSDGSFSLRFVLDSVLSVGRALDRNSRYHLVTLTSTVSPMSIVEGILPALETASGRRLGIDLGFCYCPEFVNLGNVIQGMMNPDLVLIGESDPTAGVICHGIRAKWTSNQAHWAHMSLINAELTKLCLNAYVTMKISFANMIAELCENIPGADVDVLTNALGYDQRIGHRYLVGGAAYGGPCFPRDNLALQSLARRTNSDAALVESTHMMNQHQIARTVQIILKHLAPGETVGVAGLSYKPGTHITESSHGMMLFKHLTDLGIRIIGYDPSLSENSNCESARKIMQAHTLEDLIRKSQVIVFTTPWEEFKAVRPQVFQSTSKRKTIVDCWRILAKGRFRNVAHYIGLGQYHQSQTNTRSQGPELIASNAPST